jgi:hypothetical protein
MDYLSLTCDFCGISFLRSMSEVKRKNKKSKDGKIRCLNCRSATHGMHKSSEYRSWYAMKARCKNPNRKGYERYGGRGISYDPTWDDFSVFLADMGPKKDPKLELERVDNNKDYCKENCRWATRKEQTRNRGGKRATRLYAFEGKTMCIADWAKEVGISPQSMQKRLNNGWPLEKAFSKERHDKKGSKHVKPKQA